jgi:hypothetical protein
MEIENTFCMALEGEQRVIVLGNDFNKIKEKDLNLKVQS